MKSLTPPEVAAFQSRVNTFYREHARALPWRKTTNPYPILVSEIMLQQTQVDRVIPAYSRFIKRFPTIQSLAAAPLAQVLSAWQGLGYNRRARYIQQCAQVIVRDFHGKIPRSPEDLKKLPGIGSATASSIAAFAYNAHVVFVETNIRSVFIHHFFRHKKRIRDSEILPLVAQTLPNARSRQWYAALMDYGSVLKRRVGNPSRHSAHHVRQTKFAGSNRQLRGRILRAIMTDGKCSEGQLVRITGEKRERVRHVLRELSLDKLISERRSWWEVHP